MLRFIPSHPRRIIDIGCGEGFFLSILSKRGFRADGIDGSAMAIEICRERIGKAAGLIECCFIEEFQPQEPYDLLICGEVLEHIGDDQAFLNEINRLAVMDAVLILTVPVDMTLWSSADELGGHFRRYSKPEIFMKIEKAGFSVTDYVIWGFPLIRGILPFIYRQQVDLMSSTKSSRMKERFMKKCKYILKPLSYVFLFDNLFNFTERGIDIVIRAVKTEQITTDGCQRKSD